MPVCAVEVLGVELHPGHLGSLQVMELDCHGVALFELGEGHRIGADLEVAECVRRILGGTGLVVDEGGDPVGTPIQAIESSGDVRRVQRDSERLFRPGDVGLGPGGRGHVALQLLGTILAEFRVRAFVPGCGVPCFAPEGTHLGRTHGLTRAPTHRRVMQHVVNQGAVPRLAARAYRESPPTAILKAARTALVRINVHHRDGRAIGAGRCHRSRRAPRRDHRRGRRAAANLGGGGSDQGINKGTPALIGKRTWIPSRVGQNQPILRSGAGNIEEASFLVEVGVTFGRRLRNELIRQCQPASGRCPIGPASIHTTRDDDVGPLKPFCGMGGNQDDAVDAEFDGGEFVGVATVAEYLQIAQCRGNPNVVIPFGKSFQQFAELAEVGTLLHAVRGTRRVESADEFGNLQRIEEEISNIVTHRPAAQVEDGADRASYGFRITWVERADVLIIEQIAVQKIDQGQFVLSGHLHKGEPAAIADLPRGERQAAQQRLRVLGGVDDLQQRQDVLDLGLDEETPATVHDELDVSLTQCGNPCGHVGVPPEQPGDLPAADAGVDEGTAFGGDRGHLAAFVGGVPDVHGSAGAACCQQLLGNA